MNKYLVLIRRELQENKALWIAPLVMAAIVICTLLFIPTDLEANANFSFNGLAPGAPPARAGTNVLVACYVFLSGICYLVVALYLLDCLYAERKDRSILFWKSLPVSDAETVLSKLFVGMVVVPLGVMLLALVLQPLLGLIGWLRFAEARDWLTVGAVAGWPRGMWILLNQWLFGLLWYLPVGAYLLMASVLAPRAPIVVAIVPPLALVVWEATLLDTMVIRGFFAQRLFIGSSAPPHLMQQAEAAGGMPLGVWIGSLQLWGGVAVGAVMLYTVIRLRRYRDDT